MGLLQIAEMDMRNLSILGALGKSIGFIFGGNDDGSDEGEESF